MPLHVFEIGNKLLARITHYAPIKLIGNGEEETNVKFKVLKTNIMLALSGVSKNIMDKFSRLYDHRNDLSTPILEESIQFMQSLG